jgi:hypothetical protein
MTRTSCWRDFGHLGLAWRETGVDDTHRETLIRDLAHGQYLRPVRIVAFNVGEGWSREVTMEIANELRRRYDEFGELSTPALDFLETNKR